MIVSFIRSDDAAAPPMCGSHSGALRGGSLKRDRY
jgi:hypothetical protein